MAACDSYSGWLGGGDLPGRLRSLPPAWRQSRTGSDRLSRSSLACRDRGLVLRRSGCRRPAHRVDFIVRLARLVPAASQWCQPGKPSRLAGLPRRLGSVDRGGRNAPSGRATGEYPPFLAGHSRAGSLYRCPHLRRRRQRQDFGLHAPLRPTDLVLAGRSSRAPGCGSGAGSQGRFLPRRAPDPPGSQTRRRLSGDRSGGTLAMESAG